MHAVFVGLLAIGVSFFAFEFVLHFFGLPVLEHDRIFIPTHDRYIALYALTYALLLLVNIRNAWRAPQLFVGTMVGIALGYAVAARIAAEGGYELLFPVAYLDGRLRTIGVGAYAWYALTWFAWFVGRRHLRASPS